MIISHSDMIQHIRRYKVCDVSGRCSDTEIVGSNPTRKPTGVSLLLVCG